MSQRDCNEVESNILRQYKSISETNKENFSIVSSYVYFTRANFKIHHDWKFRKVSFIFLSTTR